MTLVYRNHPYLLVALELDAEWSRSRTGSEDGALLPVARTCRNVEAVCREYADGIDSNGRKYAEASGTEPHHSLETFLFRPKFYLPDGHADCLALILVDDYDVILHLATQCKTIESLSLAFCPEVDTLGLENFSFLRPVHEIWSDNGEAEVLLSSSVVTLTRLKLDGLCSLEYGVLFKRAIYRAAARQCELAMKALRNADNAGCYSADDISSAVVSFVALQGQEEIGVLVRSSNASINMCLSSALRTLTLKHILSDDGDACVKLLREVLFLPPSQRGASLNGYKHGSLHRRLLLAHNSTSPADRNIPVFRWSKTLLGFALELSPNGVAICSKINGYVAAHIDIQLPPGQNRVADSHFHCDHSCALPSNWHLAQVGVFDGRSLFGVEHQLTSTTDVLVGILKAIEDTVQANSDGVGECVLVGLRSAFLVPVPSIDPFVFIGKVERSPLDHILTSLATDRSSGGSIAGVDFARLSAIPKSYGLPKALRRTIESLFQKFIGALLNPNLFDLVADMLDAIKTFYHALTVSIPEALPRSIGQQTQIDQLRVKGLAQYTAALKSAIERRLDLAHPASSVRNVSIQFPGSFAQILFAADAPVKACLGVLKYHIKRSGGPKGDNARGLASLHMLGVITELSLEPGIQSFDLILGADDEAINILPRLSFLRLDLDHMFHVGSYFDYAHECFHLAYDELVWKSDDREICLFARKLSFEDSFVRERFEETWVHVACMIFFASERPRSLLFHLVGKYALDVRSGGPLLAAVIQDFSEHLVRLVIATTLVERFLPDSPDNIATPKIGDVMVVLDECLGTVLQLLPETGRLKHDEIEHVKRAIRSHLYAFWGEANMEFYLAHLWGIAVRGFYFPVKRTLRYFGAAGRAQFQSSLSKLEEGWTATRHENSKLYMDGVACAATLLGDYFTRMGFPSDQFQMYVDRDSLGEVYFRNGAKCTPYLVDRGGAQRFCFDPDARGHRLRHQIAILESFGDLSAHFRARRILSILPNDTTEPNFSTDESQNLL